MKNTILFSIVLISGIFSISAQDKTTISNNTICDSCFNQKYIQKNEITYQQLFCTKTGKLKNEVPYINGRRNGLLTSWRDNGTIDGYIVYSEGHPLGIYSVYPNGHLESMKTYSLNGEHCDASFHFYENGLIKDVTYYTQGKQVDEKFYDSKGNIATNVNTSVIMPTSINGIK